MPTIDSFDIQITASTNNSRRALNDLTSGLQRASSSISNVNGRTNSFVSGMNRVRTTTAKTSKSFKGLASAIGRFYANYYYVIRGIKALYNSIESTADYIEAFNYFEVSFDKIASEWNKDYAKYGYQNAEEYAESFMKRAYEGIAPLSGLSVEVDVDGKGLLKASDVKSLGLNIQEVTQFASQLASVTNSVGQTGEVSLAASTAFTKLAGDVSSLFNKDYSDVAQNFQSGLIGQSRALYKYGVDITNASLQTLAYQLGVEKAVSEMTQAEKMQLRMIKIVEDLEVSWGDLANTINSPSNMIRQFKNNLAELGMILGQLFMPLVGKLLPLLNGITTALKRMFENIAVFFGIKLELSEGPQSEFEGLEEELEELEETAEKTKKGLRGFDELKTINTSKNDTSSLEDTIDLTDEIIKATKEYEKVWQEAYDKMENRADKFAQAISKALQPLEKLFKDIYIGDWFAVGEDVSNIVSGIFDFFSNAIEKVDWEQLGKNIGAFLEGIDWLKVLKSAVNLGKNIKDAIVDVVRGAFEEAPVETFAILAAIFWTKFGGQVAGLLPGATSSAPLAVSNIFAKLSSISAIIPQASLDMIAYSFSEKLDEAFFRIVPKKFQETVSGVFSGAAIGAAVGSVVPVVGTLAGLIVGAFVGGFATTKIDGKSILRQIIEPIFNFDYAISLFKDAGKFFKNVKKAFEDGDWLGVGKNILLGILNGIAGALVFVVEPIMDFFYVLWDAICSVFGIHSPAKEMEPLGENIFSGIVEGFKGSFSKIKEAIKDFFNKIKTWWKEKMVQLELKIKTPHLSITWDTKGALAEAAKVLGLKGMPKFKVDYYATGGYPTSGDLFFANENGVPELVGTMGGKTAVASGMEITGIKDAIYSTGQQETKLMQTMVGLLNVIAEKDFGITDSEIGRSAQRYARDYLNRTGNEAYSF